MSPAEVTQTTVPLNPDDPNSAVKDSSKSIHDHDVASAVDGVYHEPYPDANRQKNNEEEEEGEEWEHTELTWKKLPNIYLKLSKSRLTGKNSFCTSYFNS